MATGSQFYELVSGIIYVHIFERVHKYMNIGFYGILMPTNLTIWSIIVRQNYVCSCGLKNVYKAKIS
jgi:hypothetical protein